MTIAVYLLPLISLTVGLCALTLGTRLKIIDYPGHLHKTHDRPTPLVGGFAIALPLLAFCALTLWQTPGSRLYAALTVAIGGAFFMGFFDDRRHLPSLFRLLYGAALALTSIAIVPAFIVPDFNFTFLSAPLLLAPFAIAFSVLVVVGMMNAINMVDGMNGLASGLCLIWALFLLFYAPPEIFSLVVLLATCLLVTLVFNLRGRLFLGDSGTYAAGLTIGLLTVYTYNMTEGRLYADIVVAWFIVPVVDCLRLMAVRALARCSPMSPDTNHLHHRLRRLMLKRWVVPAIWAMVAVPGAVAMAVPPLTLPAVLAVTALYSAILVVSSDRFAVRRKPPAFDQPATLTE
jgi:UDP-GlcNAc:undecaprenyl-phosphate/decaprenyl-phosphate GlcNAc-1-phosphate transferase